MGPSSSLVGSERPDWPHLFAPLPRPCHPHFIVCVTFFSPNTCLVTPWAGQGRGGPSSLVPGASLALEAGHGVEVAP